MNKAKLYNYVSRFKTILSICLSICLWQIAFVVYNYDLYTKYNSMPIAGKVVMEIIATWAIIDIYKYFRPKYLRFVDYKYYFEKKAFFKKLIIGTVKQAWAVGKFFFKWGFIVFCILQPIWLIIKYYVY